MIKEEIDIRVNGKTKIMGVLGNPIEHSISPQLHNTISKLIGKNIIYVPFMCSSENLETAIKGLKALNCYGFNVTIPYKEKIINYLDECSDEAMLIGAVNTVVNRNGRLIGYNTDGDGYAASFEDATKTSFLGKDILVFGAGGASRATTLKAATKGAKTITIVNRTEKKSDEIAKLINNNTSCKAFSLNYSDTKLNTLLRKSDIIVNTTPIGMYPNVDESINKDIVFSDNQIVYDLIYNPTETLLLKRASEQGAKILNGLGMLIYQAVLAYEIITGVKISEELFSTIRTLFLDINKHI